MSRLRGKSVLIKIYISTVGNTEVNEICPLTFFHLEVKVASLQEFSKRGNTGRFSAAHWTLHLLFLSYFNYEPEITRDIIGLQLYEGYYNMLL